MDSAQDFCLFYGHIYTSVRINNPCFRFNISSLSEFNSQVKKDGKHKFRGL